jgi:membrane-associated HD superfamily phosphohydrolase
MKDKLFVIGKFIGLVIFILAFSLMGLASGKPIMVLAYAGFFIIIMAIIFMFVKKSQRHFEIISEQNPKLRKILGIAMLLVAIILPVLAIMNMQLFELGVSTIGFGILAITLVATIVLIAGGVLAVSLINNIANSKPKKILGYILLVVLSSVPALLVIPNDRTTTGIGSVYYLAVMVAVLSWWGFNLYSNKE